MAYLNYWVIILADRKSTSFHGYSKVIGGTQPVETTRIMQWIDEKEADYLIVHNNPRHDLKYLVPTIERYQNRFHLVYNINHTNVYEVITPDR